MKTCYKVVKVENEKLVSCSVTKKAQVIYEENKWIKAPKWLRDVNLGLFVFETSELAEDFVHSLKIDNCQIWRCQYRCKTENPKYFSLTELANGRISETIFAKSFPTGTIQVKQVKLIRRIS